MLRSSAFTQPALTDDHLAQCDGKRPACSQCLFLGRSCEGYQVDAVFLPYQPGPRKRRPGKARPSAPSGEAQKSAALQSKAENTSLAEVRAQRGWRCPPPRPVDAPTAGELTAVILSCFVPEHGDNVPSSLDSSTIQVCGAWVGVLPRLAHGMRSGALLSAAVKAFGTAILDRGPEGRRLNFRSLEAYNSTLQQLQQDLAAPNVSFNVKTAASIACLAMVEVSAVALILEMDFE